MKVTFTVFFTSLTFVSSHRSLIPSDLADCLFSLLVTGATAITCGQQGTPRKPAVCMASTAQPCPQGYRPVFYDNPSPCKNGQRCCI